MAVRKFPAAAVYFACVSAVAGVVPTPDHVVIVVEENRAGSEILGNSAAPFINSLANGGASFDQFYALSHPSQPNYLNLFSGSDQGVSDNAHPSGPFTTPNLAASLASKGYTFGGYSESLPSTGWNGDVSGGYARKHNPWANWQSASPAGNQLPPSVNMSLSSFPSDFSKLPTVSFVVPSLANDMHDGSIGAGDAWLSSKLGAYNTWAKANNSLLVVTWDEDEGNDNNRVATILSGPMVKPGVYSSTYSHFNLLRTVSDMYGVAAPGAAAASSGITGVWGNQRSTTATAATATAITTAATITTAITAINGDSHLPQRLERLHRAHDTYIAVAGPKSSHGGSSPEVAGGTTASTALLRFDSLFGSSATQIPKGAAITSAKLSIKTASGSADGSSSRFELHRLLKSFTESSTWDSLKGGISADGIESLKTADATVTPGGVGKLVTFDVTKSLRAWAAGSPDFGWAILAKGTDAWRFDSSEFSSIPLRPTLQVSFTAASGLSAQLLTAVPEPAGVTLMATAVGATLLRRRRNRC